MEKTDELQNEDISFKQEILGVYNELIKYRHDIKNHQVDEPYYKTRLGLVSIGFVLILFILIAALYFLPQSFWGDNENQIRFVVQFIVLATYAITGLILIAHAVSLKNAFKNFTGQMISILNDAAEQEALLFEKINSYSDESIQYVANRVEQTADQIGKIRSFLLGAVEKVGIIPGIVTSILAINKITNTTAGMSWVEWLSVMLLVFYLFIFPIIEADLKLRRISLLLNDYLNLMRIEK